MTRPKGHREAIFLLPGGIALAQEPSRIITLLGSCVAVALHDPALALTGVTHYLLPSPTEGSEKTPRYGSVAIARLLAEFERRGGRPGKLQAKIYGGADVLDNVSIGSGVGQANIALAISMLEQARIPVVAQSLGGRRGRRIVVFSDTFEVEQVLMSAAGGKRHG